MKRSRGANFADIIKTRTMFVKITFESSAKVKRIKNYESKFNLYPYWLIFFGCFLGKLLICQDSLLWDMSDRFLRGGGGEVCVEHFAPETRQQPQKGSSWIGLILSARNPSKMDFSTSSVVIFSSKTNCSHWETLSTNGFSFVTHIQCLKTQSGRKFQYISWGSYGVLKNQYPKMTLLKSRLQHKLI